MVGFGTCGGDASVILDGKPVPEINAGLSCGLDFTTSQVLAGNADRCFMGTTKVGLFDIEETYALRMLSDPNPNGKPNSDVVRPFRNGSDLVQECSNRWVIDFGTDMTETEASLYSMPFGNLVENVRPQHVVNADKNRAAKWWLLGEPFRIFDTPFPQCHATLGRRIAKHRIFVWLDAVILPDSKVIAIAYADDYHFGIIHSKVHNLWTLALCGWHGKGNDPTYNPTTCFETFPFPEPTAEQMGGRDGPRLDSACCATIG